MTILLLTALHFLSPEFDPSNRMVSEYALGEYGRVLSGFFISWAISSWALAFALWQPVRTTAGKVGLILLVVSGIGEAMAAYFDVKHSLHGVAALIGIPNLPIGATLISVSLTRNPEWLPARRFLLGTALLTWYSLIAMMVTVITMFAIAGYMNRFLIVIFCIWLMTAAWIRIKQSTKQHV